MPDTVLITRPHPQAQETARSVVALGLRPVVAPLLVTTALPATLPADADAVLLTSRNAIPALPAWAKHRPVLTVGDTTAALTRAAGCTRVLSAGGTASELATLVEQTIPSGARLLLLSGRGNGLDLVHQLRAWRVERHEVYHAAPLETLPPAAADALRAGPLRAALFFSPQTSACFARLVEAAGLTHALHDTEACAISEPAAVALRALPWRCIRIATHPTQDALLELLA